MTKRTAPLVSLKWNWFSEIFEINNIQKSEKNSKSRRRFVNGFTLLTFGLWITLFFYKPSKEINWIIFQVIAFLSICFGNIIFNMQNYMENETKANDFKTINFLFFASAIWTISALIHNYFYDSIKDGNSAIHNKIFAVLSALNSFCFLVVIKELTSFDKEKPLFISDFQKCLKHKWKGLRIYFFSFIFVIIPFALDTKYFVLDKTLAEYYSDWIMSLIDSKCKPNLYAAVDFLFLGSITIASFEVLYKAGGKENRNFEQLKPLIIVAISLTIFQQIETSIGGLNYLFRLKEDNVFFTMLPLLYKITIYLVFFVLLYTYVLKKKGKANLAEFKYSILTAGNFHDDDTQKEGRRALNLFLGNEEDFKWTVDDLSHVPGVDSFTVTLLKQLKDNQFSVAVLWLVAYAAFTNKGKLKQENMTLPRDEDLGKYPSFNFKGFNENTYWDLIYTLYNLFKSLRPVKHKGYINNAWLDKYRYIMEFKDVEISKLRDSIVKYMESNYSSTYTRDTSSNLIKLGNNLSLVVAPKEDEKDKVYKRRDRFAYDLGYDPTIKDEGQNKYPNNTLILIFDFKPF